MMPVPYSVLILPSRYQTMYSSSMPMNPSIDMLNDYMVWYRDKRIKTEYGTGIMDRRRKLGLVA